MTPRTKSPNGRALLEPPSDLSLESRERWPRFLADVAGTDDRGQACEVDALLLAELLRTCDRLAQVREQLSSDGLTVTGSQDQTRPHPLLGVERQLVAELA